LNKGAPIKNTMAANTPIAIIKNIVEPEDYLNSTQLTFIKEHSLGWLDKYENNFDIFN